MKKTNVQQFIQLYKINIVVNKQNSNNKTRKRKKENPTKKKQNSKKTSFVFKHNMWKNYK